jgi:prominin 1
MHSKFNIFFPGALQQCSANVACSTFMQEYDIRNDLAIAQDFSKLPTDLPNVSIFLKDITDLMNNDIEKKVRVGQKQLDKVKIDIENSMGDLRPKIKDEIRKMGRKLESKADEIKNILSHVRGHVKSIREGIQELGVPDVLEEYGIYVYYIGLGMSSLVLLVLSCHILGKGTKLIPYFRE